MSSQYENTIKVAVRDALMTKGMQLDAILKPLLFMVAAVIVAANRQNGKSLEELTEVVRHDLDEAIVERSIAYDRM